MSVCEECKKRDDYNGVGICNNILLIIQTSLYSNNVRDICKLKCNTCQYNTNCQHNIN
jgi:hypothetical protein